MRICTIPFDSHAYDDMRQLRVEALLQPIGVPPTYIVPVNEKNDVFVAAYEGAALIGCCILTAKDVTTIQLRQMVVHPVWQGQGIGTAIVLYAEDLAKRQGYQVLVMHARDPVIPFYQKLGYSITGPAFFEVGIGHHKMQKSL